MTKSVGFALITAVLWGFTSVLAKIGLKGNLDPLAATVVRSLGIAVCMSTTLVVAGKGQSLIQADPKSILCIAAVGLIAGGLAQWTYYVALKNGEASQIVPVAATYPLVALVFSLIFLGESLSLSKGIGTVLIVIGIISIQ